MDCVGRNNRKPSGGNEKHCKDIEMSSPGGVKGHSQEQSLPEDYNTPVAEMETNHILKSTLTSESRQEKGDTKTCLCPGDLRPEPPGPGKCFEESAAVQSIYVAH
jgi:hypothetical protein